nr:unnamed protein product [Callosobruchus chinensis]CAH7758161.1 unnamed protein product [Callosobruchus chinensis]CAH7759503.1 unnamed protein product [Callosobruchus chinensis]
MASVTNSTLKQYNSALKLWWEYCIDNNLEIFSVTQIDVLKFLSSQFHRGCSHGTLSSYRSAIGQITGEEVLQGLLLKRFFKGIYNLRPNQPKYDSIWDPSIVLDFIEKWNNDTLNLRDLTFKLTILLLLSTGQRVQTIANIEVCNIVNSSDGISIKIPKRLKTSGKNKAQPNIRNSQTNNLLITFKKPYKNASSQSISRWVKCMLKLCGIDTDIFTAHSTRHAATSAAALKGISIDTIRCSAGWSEKSQVFGRFYNRPIIINNFAESILGNR